MAKIKESALIKAIKQSNQMDFTELEKVVDEIYLEQPNLLASVLVQSKMGNKIEDVDVLLNILIVTFLALRYSNIKLEMITEKLQEKEMAKYAGHFKFLDGLNQENTEQAIHQFSNSKSEKILLSYVIGAMMDAGFTKRKNESSKYLLMSGINIINCICVAKIA
ncbi:MAG: hypothetical protein ACI9F1_002393 [Colwellia sp.]|jgi:hypothetical protein